MVTDKEQFDTLEYYSFVRNKIEKNPDVDGVFTSSDIIGAYVLQACRDLSISVPQNMKIVGFDDVNIAQFTTPGLTTIHQPVEQMAEPGNFGHCDDRCWQGGAFKNCISGNAC